MCVWIYRHAHVYVNIEISTIIEEELKGIIKGIFGGREGS